MNRIAKSTANYTPNTKRMPERCGACAMFRRTNSCTLVKGKIAFNGWCKYFEAK